MENLCLCVSCQGGKILRCSILKPLAHAKHKYPGEPLNKSLAMQASYTWPFLIRQQIVCIEQFVSVPEIVLGLL